MRDLEFDEDLPGMPPMPPIGRGRPLPPDYYAWRDAEHVRMARTEATLARNNAVLIADPGSEEARRIAAKRAHNRAYRATLKAKQKARLHA